MKNCCPKEALTEALDAAFDNLFDAPTVSSWAETYHNLSPELSSVEGMIELDPYQQPLLDVMGDPDTPARQVFLKSARATFSTNLQITAAHALTVRRLNVLYYLPNDVEARACMKDTINPMLRDNLVTRKFLQEVDKRDATSRQDKYLAGKILRVRGATSPVAARRISSDLLMQDEVDTFPSNLGAAQAGPTGAGKAGEGNPLAVQFRAVKDSPFRRVLMGSTPKSVTESMIYAEYLTTTMRFSFHVSCPKCGHLEPLRWSMVVFDTKGNIDQRSASAKFKCVFCRKLWSYSKLRKAEEKGFWMVPLKSTTELEDNPDFLDDDQVEFAGYWIDAPGDRPPVLRNPKGKKIPWPSSIGFHQNALYSLRYPLNKVVQEFLEGKDDPGKLAAFTGHVRGLPWSETGASSLALEDVKKLVKYNPLLDNEYKVLVAAIDCQQWGLSMMLCAYTGKHRVMIVDRIEFKGDMSTPTSAAWNDLRQWLARNPEWSRKDEVKLPVDILIIDGGYMQTTVARAFPTLPVAKKYLIKGQGGWDTAIVRRGKVTPESQGQLLYNIGSSQAKLEVMRKFQEGHVEISDWVRSEVLEELTAEKIIKQRIGGKMRYKWVHFRKEIPNEALDQLGYSYAAILLANPDFAMIRFTPEEREIYDKNSQAAVDKYYKNPERRERVRLRSAQKNAEVRQKKALSGPREIVRANILDDE